MTKMLEPESGSAIEKYDRTFFFPSLDEYQLDPRDIEFEAIDKFFKTTYEPDMSDFLAEELRRAHLCMAEYIYKLKVYDNIYIRATLQFSFPKKAMIIVPQIATHEEIPSMGATFQPVSMLNNFHPMFQGSTIDEYQNLMIPLTPWVRVEETPMQTHRVSAVESIAEMVGLLREVYADTVTGRATAFLQSNLIAHFDTGSLLTEPTDKSLSEYEPKKTTQLEHIGTPAYVSSVKSQEWQRKLHRLIPDIRVLPQALKIDPVPRADVPDPMAQLIDAISANIWAVLCTDPKYARPLQTALNHRQGGNQTALKYDDNSVIHIQTYLTKICNQFFYTWGILHHAALCNIPGREKDAGMKLFPFIYIPVCEREVPIGIRRYIGGLSQAMLSTLTLDHQVNESYKKHELEEKEHELKMSQLDVQKKYYHDQIQVQLAQAHAAAMRRP